MLAFNHNKQGRLDQELRNRKMSDSRTKDQDKWCHRDQEKTKRPQRLRNSIDRCTEWCAGKPVLPVVLYDACRGT